MKIAIAGTGYVELSTAVLLPQHQKVAALEFVPKKVAMINPRQSPIEDAQIMDCLDNKKLNLNTTLDKHEAYDRAVFAVIATPTDYDPETNCFNTRSVETVIKHAVAINPRAAMVIKATVPVGCPRPILG